MPYSGPQFCYLRTPFNAKPITDNSPFFYNYSKLIPKEMVLILAFIIALVVSFKFKYLKDINRKKASVYFGGLGIAYMLVEIPLIQSMVLYLGSSSLAFSFVVFSLLISSGIGSLVSGTKLVERFNIKAPYYIMASELLIIANQIGLESILNLSRSWDVTNKLIIIFLNSFPMGFMMGMAYPSGIKKIGVLKNEHSIIPLMIGVNSIFSVLGSTLAVVLSMLFGFKQTIYLGAIIYILIFIYNPLKSYDRS